MIPSVVLKIKPATPCLLTHCLSFNYYAQLLLNGNENFVMKVAWITCPKCHKRFYVEFLMLKEIHPQTGTKPFCRCCWCLAEFTAKEAERVEV